MSTGDVHIAASPRADSVKERGQEMSENEFLTAW